jgi:hypothetical protein
MATVKGDRQFWNQIISIQKNLNGRIFDVNTITFYNVGTVTVTILDYLVLPPGYSYTFQGYPGEINSTAFKIEFEDNSINGQNLLAILKDFGNG